MSSPELLSLGGNASYLSDDHSSDSDESSLLTLKNNEDETCFKMDANDDDEVSLRLVNTDFKALPSYKAPHRSASVDSLSSDSGSIALVTTATKAKSSLKSIGDGKVCLLNKRFKFLPDVKDTDFTLVCSDKRYADGVNPYRAPRAFAVRLEELSKHCTLFQVPEGRTGQPAGRYITLEEPNSSVVLVLSAIFEPFGSFLSEQNWHRLESALALAVKWGCDKARSAFFHAMLFSVSSFKDAKEGAHDHRYPIRISTMLAEASCQGDAAFRHAFNVIRSRRKAGKKPISVLPVKLSEAYALELGLERYTSVVDAMALLLGEGAIVRVCPPSEWQFWMEE